MYIIGDDIVTHALVNSDANKIKEFIDYGKSYNSAEGDLITLTDSIKAPLKSLHIYGESNQTQLTGSQLAVLPDVNPTDNNGVIWSCVNGVVTAKGTPTNISTTSTFLAYYMSEGTAGVFTVSGSSNPAMVYVYILRADNTQEYIWDKSFTLDGTEQRVRLYMQVDTGNAVNTTIYPMLNAGDTALPFEPYCGGIPSPNPEYPQAIQSVGDDGSLAVNVCGKNLFDMETNTVIYNSCKIKSRTDTSITIESASTGFYIGCGGQGSTTAKCSEKRAIKVKPNTVYACSHIYTTTNTSATSGFYVQFYDSECNPILAVNGAKWLGIRSLEGTFTTPSTARYAVVNVQVLYIQAGDIVTISNIQLEEGSTATSYEPYKSTSAALTSALPLCSVGDVKDEVIYNADGTAKVIKRNLKYVVDTDTSVASYTALGTHARCQIVRYYTPGMPVSNVLCNIFPSKINYGEDTPHTFVDGTSLWAYAPIEELSTQDNEGVKAWLISKGAEFVYPLATPQEIPLTAEETSMLQDLITYTPSTTFYADGADMKVEYYNNKLYAIDARVNTLTEKINAIETALITE